VLNRVVGSALAFSPCLPLNPIIIDSLCDSQVKKTQGHFNTVCPKHGPILSPNVERVSFAVIVPFTRLLWRLQLDQDNLGLLTKALNQ
jgi:hypothetical protein